MTRIPPALSYLTIYNPTLRPFDAAADDDEDAEAQAHILFYTSKETAVSRDRILRQVGLAKALVHFAELFNTQTSCDSVRSQARRMIMVSPEPDFWIHAGIEVAKSVQAPLNKGKGKLKDKSKTNQDPAPVYEFHDESVQDEAVRSLLLRGYEQFKLTHGSFTQIMSAMGQEVLELQLERFFTVWAWSLNLENLPDFGEHLGVPLHPAYRKIVKLLDSFEEDGHSVSIFAQPPHITPSSNYFTRGYPLSLLRHVLNLVPRPHLTSDPSHDLGTSGTENDAMPLEEAQNDTSHQQGTNFSGPDSQKWYWPPYLTFGGKPPLKPNDDVERTPEAAASQDEVKIDEPQLSEVDTNALEDAMSTSVSVSTIKAESDGQTEMPQSEEADALPLSQSDPELQTSFVHLSGPAKPSLTIRRPLYYFIDDQRLLAVVPPEEEELSTTGTELSRRAAAFFRELEGASEDDVVLSSTEQLPSAAKILQPSDRHTMAKEGLTCSNPLFSSRSHRLYEIQRILDIDPEINEAFCRGQNPQHWHVAKRGLSVASDQPTSEQGEVYLEVFRKESSLADVDNVLAGIVRKSDTVDY